MSVAHDGQTAVEAALASVTKGGDENAALRAIARADLLLPRLAGAAEPGSGGLALPVVEEEGKSFVPVFTSQTQLSAALPEATGAVVVRGASLAAGWPSDTPLWLAINPASEHAATLPPDAVRSLASLAADPEPDQAP
jgi:SseB protein N-terminal domain